jgi:3',5'-cyclic AMP phosphodiesterase CpdA
MSAARVVVVSDSHLSARTPEATDHWGALVDHVTATVPDLVVHAGDISTDGEVLPDDLAFARAQLNRVPVPLAVLPGNHDIGDGAAWTYDGAAAVGAETLGRYSRAFGPDRFFVEVGTWRLVGINAQLLGSGEPEEGEHWDWLSDEIGRLAPGTPVGVVLHKPLVPADGDRDRPGRYVPEPARGRLLALLAAVDTRLVVSGHVHQALRRDRDGVAHVWVASSWAVLPDRIQAPIGAKWVGATGLALHDDGRVDVTDIRLPDVDDVVIGEDVPSPYGELPPLDPL